MSSFLLIETSLRKALKWGRAVHSSPSSEVTDNQCKQSKLPQTKILRVGEVGEKNVKLQENQFGFQKISVTPSEKTDINSARWQNKQCLLFWSFRGYSSLSRLSVQYNHYSTSEKWQVISVFLYFYIFRIFFSDLGEGTNSTQRES